MRNDRLRSQLATARITPAQLASTLEVDPKTVERWIGTGRVPHQRHRLEAAEVLGASETYLWPDLLTGPHAGSSSAPEVLEVFPHRGAVPADLWRALAHDSREFVEVLVYSGLFLLDTHPDLPARLAERAQDGLRARFLYGDPESETVAWRGREEGIGDDLAARVRLSLLYIQPVLGVPGIEVRQHNTILYNSIYRFDDEMLVNTHVMGSPAPRNPVLHLRRTEGGQLFDHYLGSFEHVWESATPLEPTP